jgi:SHS2 domain-containing protein
MNAMHELFDHTADLGIRATANDLNTLFAQAAIGLASAIVEDVHAIELRTTITLEIVGDDREYLLFDFLRELLLIFETTGELYRDFAVTVRDDGLTAIARGEPLDRSRHLLSHEVKAITYHELKVQPHDDGWLAEVIVDI